MRMIYRIALALTIIGAINWGLIGFLQFDLVGAIFGGQSAFLSRVIFALVGISGLVCLTRLFEPAEKVEHDMNRQGNRNLNFSTEFSEETDLSKVNKK